MPVRPEPTADALGRAHQPSDLSGQAHDPGHGHGQDHGHAHGRWHGHWPSADESGYPWGPDWPSGREWAPPRALTLWLPVVLSAAVQLPIAIWFLRLALMTDTRVVTAALNVAVAVAGPLVLIAARRAPGPVVAIVAAAASADLLLDFEGPPYIALGFAVVGAIVRGARLWAFISIGVAWLVTLTVGIASGGVWSPLQIAVTTLGILIVVGVGESIRTRRERFEEMRARYRQRRQSEVQAERVRIARELHDVLAHSLSQINVQAGVGLHLMDRQPDRAAEALASIKDTSKTALDEVRIVLGALRAEGGDPDAPLVPEADLGRLPGLIAATEEHGLRVDLDNRLGEAPKPVQLAMFRIVQESLTNVRRHADATRVRISLTEQAGRYRLEVVDDGHGAPERPNPDHDGRGLLGMRERAELLGGTLDVGPGPGGGFRVAVELPVRHHEGEAG